MTELVYQHHNVPKDEKNLGLYKNDQVRIEDFCFFSRDIFLREFPQADIRALQNAGNDLIEWAFGKGIVDFFNYAQSKLNSTEFQRIGGEELKDAYIFIHSVRVLERMGTTYEKQLALLHDLFEEMNDFRKNKIDELKQEKASAIEVAWKAKIEEEAISKIKQGYDEQIETYKRFIEEPPEREDIRGLFKNYFTGIYDEKKAEILAEVALRHLSMLTRDSELNEREDYTEYINRFVEGVDSKEIQALLRSAGIEGEEAMEFYRAPLNVKLEDTRDNTERSREIDILRNYRRLGHNHILISGIDRFIEKYKIEEGSIVDRRNGLLRASMKELNFNIKTKYKGDDNPHIQSYLNKLRELRDIYNQLPEKMGKNSSVMHQIVSTFI